MTTQMAPLPASKVAGPEMAALAPWYDCDFEQEQRLTHGTHVGWRAATETTS